MGDDRQQLISMEYGEPLDGWMAPSEMVELTKDVIEWPPGTAALKGWL